MKVCHFTEFERFLQGGIKTSIRHQRKALDIEGVEYTTDPSEDYDILHLNLLGPRSLYLMERTLMKDVKVVVHTHTTAEDFRDSMSLSNIVSPAVDVYTRAFYSRADQLIAPSAYTKRLIQGKGIEKPVSVVSNGIDTERLEGCGESREGEFTALNLGLVFERKGLSDFVETGGRMSDTRFVWHGPKLNRFLRSRRVKKEIDGSPSNVEFPGFIEDVRDAFAEADVFFFPTKEENQGIALLEAAYCGLPLVVRDISTYEGWLEHGKNCLKADSVEGFVEQLERLKEDGELRDRLGENAREMAEKHTLEKVGERLGEVYQEVAEG